MRGILITALIFGSIPFIFMRPWLGVLVFSWFSYMNPHRLAWGFVQTMPFAMIIGALTFVVWLVSKENKKYPMTPLSILMVVFVLWCTLTTALAYMDSAWEYWLRYVKIMAMIFLTMIVIQDRKRITTLIWVIVVSIGFYGVKGGLFGILTGGGDRVWGPPDSFIADNNALAMALVMLIPLVRFLHLESRDKWIKLGLMLSIPLMVLSVLASYSRGGFLGLSAMLFFLAVKSKNRIGYGILIVIALAGTLSLMPDKYFDRLNTIESSSNTSADTENTRIASWRFATDVANERPIIGGGFNFFDYSPIVIKYASPAAIYGIGPNGPVGRAMHSIYFDVLGTQGWVGLILWLVILILAYRSCTWVRRRVKPRPDLAWLNNLASMLQVSMVGMCTAGAFQNLVFFDLTWHVISFTVLVKLMAQRELAKPAPDPATIPAAALRGARGRFTRPVPVHARPAPIGPGRLSSPTRRSPRA
jgi:probable O-glycosylation ligase (exosortase A-associated)